jgi:hypothetical protein
VFIIDYFLSLFARDSPPFCVGSVLNKAKSFSDVESDEFGNVLALNSQVPHAKKTRDSKEFKTTTITLFLFSL